MTVRLAPRRAAAALALLASAPLARLGAQVSTPVAGGLSGPGVVEPTAYSLLNGNDGSWRYVDHTYASGACGGVCPNANVLGGALSGGLGLLTDGTAAPGGYADSPNAPGNPQGYWVGWRSSANAAPSVTFTFASALRFDVLRIHLEDTQDVQPPASITVNGGFESATFSITDPAGRNPFWTELALAPHLLMPTSQLTLTFAYSASSSWLMTSEVDFAATSTVPEPGTVTLVALGLLGVGAAVRRRSRAG